MHASFNRRTATKVKSGRVQRKNRHRPTGQEGLVLDRWSPGRGFRHVVTKRDLQAFIEIIPEWPRFSERLERIVLAGRCDDADAVYHFYHREETGGIFLHPWPDDLWIYLTVPYFEAHREIFEKMGVSYDGRVVRLVGRHSAVPVYGVAGAGLRAIARIHARTGTLLR